MFDSLTLCSRGCPTKSFTNQEQYFEKIFAPPLVSHVTDPVEPGLWSQVEIIIRPILLELEL